MKNIVCSVVTIYAVLSVGQVCAQSVHPSHVTVHSTSSAIFSTDTVLRKLESDILAEIRRLPEMQVEQYHLAALKDSLSSPSSQKTTTDEQVKQAELKLEAARTSYFAVLDAPNRVDEWFADWIFADNNSNSSGNENGSSNTVYTEAVVLKPLRNLLRQYLTLNQARSTSDFATLFSSVQQSGTEHSAKYLMSAAPLDGCTLADISLWLEDMGRTQPAARDMVVTLRGQLRQPNLYFSVKNDLAAAFFRQPLDSTFPVSECINGSLVSGNGVANGLTAAGWTPSVPGTNGAALMIRVDADLHSNTVSRKSIVTVASESTGPMTSLKHLTITADKITAQSAMAKGKLDTTINGTWIQGGPILQHIARLQMRHEQPVTMSQAKRVAEIRFGQRVDTAATPAIQELNRQLKEEIWTPLSDVGLSPQDWRFYSTHNEMVAAVLLADPYQPAAVSAPPAIPESVSQKSDVVVSLHQSAMNNLATLLLAGRTFDELRVAEDLKERRRQEGCEFDESKDIFGRETNEAPLIVSFAKKAPISVQFGDNRVSVTFRFDKLQEWQPNLEKRTSYPGLDITICYAIKTPYRSSSDTTNGGTPNGLTGDKVDGRTNSTIVLELLETTVYPPGFDPTGTERIPARYQLIRTTVQRRLTNSLPQTIELAGRNLPGRKLPNGMVAESPGFIIPELLATSGGWLSLALDLKE